MVPLRAPVYLAVLLASLSGCRAARGRPPAPVRPDVGTLAHGEGVTLRWSWTDPLDPVVVTTRSVADGKATVLRVRHEADHGGWQFYDERDLGGRKPVVLPKADILRLDSTLHDVIDLPVGWEAERSARGRPWDRRPIPAPPERR